MSYSIRYLEQISGIKAHTLRIWEKRYGVLKPERTDTNIRTYSNEELKKLLNIKLLIDNGYKISEISRLKEPEVERLLNNILSHSDSVPEHQKIYINSLISAAIDFDSYLLEKTFSTCVLKFGFTATVDEILYPLLVKIGLLWQQKKLHPAQEHFVLNFARQKFFTAIDGIPFPPAGKNRYLLFLPEFEDHEIGLLYSYYLLLKSGNQAIYLGQRVPLESLIATIGSIKPTHLLSFIITQQSSILATRYLSEVAAAFSNQKIYLSGNLGFLKKLKIPSSIKLFESPDQLKVKLSL